jgi:hypothetical protein
VGSAIIGLVGVVVGAMIVTSVEFWRTMSERKGQRKTAATMIMFDLLGASVRAQSAAEHERWPVGRRSHLLAWYEFGPSLASWLDRGAFEAIATAFRSVEANEERGMANPAGTLDTSAVEMIRDSIDYLAAGMAVTSGLLGKYERNRPALTLPVLASMAQAQGDGQD